MEKVKAVAKEIAPVAVLAILGVSPIILQAVGGVVSLG
jgi:hypothetical protein